LGQRRNPAGNPVIKRAPTATSRSQLVTAILA
jgi:hypothetical protein